MTNYAVLIGNSEFPNEPSLKPLSCPPQDVEGLKAVLTAENRGQFLADNISVLVNAESKQVAREINRVLKAAGKDDLVLLYYSGHGLPNNRNNLFLSAHDTESELLESTAVSFNQIYELINTFYCKKIIIILDCCYSGAAGAVFKGDIPSQLQTINDKVTGTFLITATSNDQVAIDKTADSRFSLFTKHLIDGLETGAADTDGNGWISIDELFRYVSKKVTEDNPNQIPKRFGKNETGEMVVAKSGRDSRKEKNEKLEAFFLDLKKEKRIARDILLAVLDMLEKKESDFSAIEKQQYELVLAVYESKIESVEFVRKWDKLSSQPDLPGFKNLEGLKPEPPVIITPSKTIAEPPATWQCPVTGMEFVFIKPGTFMMGSPESEEGRSDDERLHQVTIEKGFYLGKYLVTQAQWQQVMGNNPSSFEGDNLPVETVNWNDVQEFLQKLNAKADKNYRLPTEAEWEYACRAGTTTPFSCGETISTELANYNGNGVYGKGKKGVYRRQTTAVGSFPANSWGLHDMAGNVWEWTCSDYSENYDGNETKCSSGSGTLRAIRGGSWFSRPRWLRSAYRNRSYPTYRSFILGFRISRM